MMCSNNKKYSMIDDGNDMVSEHGGSMPLSSVVVFVKSIATTIVIIVVS